MARGNPNWGKKAIEGDKAEEISVGVEGLKEGIPILEGKPSGIEIIGGIKYYEMVIHEQDSDAKRTDIYVTDGQSRDFQVRFDVPCILPQGVLNVLRECVYTIMDCAYDAKEGKAWLTERQVARFSIQINREVPQEEAEQWLDKQKRKYFKV